MDQQQILSSLEVRARQVGLPMSEVCRRAGIHPTTFSRWKLSDKNQQPKGASIPSVAKLEAVISQAESRSEQGAAA